MEKEIGYIIHEGPSRIDGKPIVVIATMKTTNRKTGDMVQTWILRSDINPVEASKTKQDKSICGDCIHRHSLGGDCYVNIGQAPLSVYKAYKNGRYKDISNSRDIGAYFINRAVRFGAYGDPYCIPLKIIKSIVSGCKAHTGYTHQWKRKAARLYSEYIMGQYKRR
jgi:hypothetical protein